MESTVNFPFESAPPDASKRINVIIERAFTNYEVIEHRKHVEDKTRYFYIQVDTTTGSSGGDNNATPVVAYRRYALGEEKTFNNLFSRNSSRCCSNWTTSSRSGKSAINGFPYKLGLVLHGPPGTGQISLIKAVKQYTKRHVVTSSLGKQLLRALRHEVRRAGLNLPIEMDFKDVVFVTEDIDCASSIVKARVSDGTNTESKSAGVGDDKPPQSEDDKMIKACLEDEKKYNMRNDKLNLSGLLDVLDGVIDCPGRIVIMTNHLEKLDPVLMPPNHVNKNLLLGYMGCTQSQQMIEYYCVTTLDEFPVRRLGDAFEFSAKHDDVDAVLSGFERLAVRP
ncbi:hypothetical protein PR003_g25392 [Phytophthora rubi]|uniref:AAA+ ATPase domain-containing protein n=1 Tax=Phytophthora rubi TaxID=129364 RepID=A0A6A3IB81_9STRA|nr:hypothetical protein PR002_g24467 [Phytophthora rubi]KAE8981108.1 hypothetical protein PR001_g24098 [Phytophthora rubi]KAE9290034.1 hypothetical protein PR003_g25392 [Phytophthora rubi]